MFLGICDYEIGILERMMVCGSQQAEPRSHTNQGETRAASTLSVPPGSNMSPPTLLLVSYLCAAHSLPKVTWGTRGAASNIYQEGAEGIVFRISTGSNVFLLQNFQTRSEAQRASYPVRNGAVSLGLKRPWREADHSPPFSAVGKN
jgi:hypothetical protein